MSSIPVKGMPASNLLTVLFGESLKAQTRVRRGETSSQKVTAKTTGFGDQSISGRMSWMYKLSGSF
uniref:Uncharacterized protein n=1 Tax=Anguilla anguilla TaxID=7936 RepID=A0A0E9WDR9_ANGAN